MPTPKKKRANQNNDDFVSPTMSTIMKWAHEGTKQSVQNLERFIEETKDDNLRGMARIALDESNFNHLSPNNKQEEEDFELASMIADEQERLFRLQEKLEAAEHELALLDIKKKVHEALIAHSNKEHKEAWKYNFSEDFKSMVIMRRDELQEEALYLDAWIEQARKLIKTDKYKNLPYGSLDCFHSFLEGVSFWDDDFDDGEDDDEDEDEVCS